MKTDCGRGLKRLVAGVLLLTLPGAVLAWEPNVKDRQEAIKKGDFTAYGDSLSAWLKKRVPADPVQITKSKMKALLRDPAFTNVLIERQFISKAWGMGDFAKANPENAAFVTWIMSDPKLMDEVLLTRTPSAMFARYDNSWSIEARYLDVWKRIYDAYPESRKGVCLRLAVAATLRPPGSGSQGAGGAKTPVDPVDRYAHFQKAYLNGELMPSFETLSAWEMTHVVSAGASDHDLAWLRDTVNTFAPGFREGEKVGTLTSQMQYQGSQIPYNDMSCLLAGGGKCGPRSSFGVFVNQAFGIPSIGVGQPAHAAVAHRDMNGNWQVTYGRSWNVSKLADQFMMSGGEFLERTKERSNGAFAQLEHMRWLAGFVSDKAKADAIMVAGESIRKDRMELIDTTAFDRKPDASAMLTAFEAPTSVADNYIARMRGLVYPPASGDYVFGISADDTADLFLSTDEDPENKVWIANLREWAEPGNFTKFPTQTSQPVRLEAGRKYYIEAVHKENAGGDHLVVVWSGPSLEQSVIPGANLSAYPTGGKGKIAREVWNDSGKTALPSAAVGNRPEAPIKVAPGVIHVEAEDFFTQGGMGGFGHPGVVTSDCYEGGKQINFSAMVSATWAGYKIHVPKTGVYELTASAAVLTWHQNLYVRSFGAMYPVAKATASDVFRDQVDNLGPQLAVDSNLGTRWAMNFGKEEGWLELDLGSPKEISKVMIEESNLNNVSRFQVDYRAGDEWVKLFDGQTIGSFKKEFPPVAAQSVRLCTFDTNSQTGGPSIWEFSVGNQFDGTSSISPEWQGARNGKWQITKPNEITLVEGDQTIWLCAGWQRGLALRWFELAPKK